MNLFVHSIEGFFKTLQQYQEISKTFQFEKEVRYSAFKQDRDSYLQRCFNIDRVMSGLTKCSYARFLNYVITEDVEQFALEFLQKHGNPKEDIDFVKQLFEKAYGLFETNVLYNMQVHTIQPAEIVIAILFYLDVDQR